MRIITGRTIFEKPPFLTHYVLFTNILQTVNRVPKEPEHNMGSAVRRGDES